MNDSPPPKAGATLDMAGADFRRLGYRLVDRIADYLDSLPTRDAASGIGLAEVRAKVGEAGLPRDGASADALLDEAADLIIAHSRHNGHPRSWGYVIGSPAPIGMLGDLLASAVNPNLAGWSSSPAASEIETQTVRWIAELLGYPADCGGLLVSGGNMANFIGVLAARRARADWDLRGEGLGGADRPRLCLYVSEETHTWIQKAADLFGLGTAAIRWIATDGDLRMDMKGLRQAVAEDWAAGHQPFLVVGTAGTVSTGAVDPLPEIADFAKAEGLWFHVDGAYGAPAVVAEGAPADLAGLRRADSLAIDGHKWLFAPLEAGCALVRDRQALLDTFSYKPSYYHYPTDAGERIVNFHELGPQNSRCFRALKVWLILRQIGAEAYRREVARNLGLAESMHRWLAAAPEIETWTRGLSITTFRYRPRDLDGKDAQTEAYLDDLNRDLLTAIQRGGEAFLSNAVVEGHFLLRACITNFRTGEADVAALPEIVMRLGESLDRKMRPQALGG